MTEQEINNIFAKLVSDQMFDSFSADEEVAAKTFMFIAGADAMREELIALLEKMEKLNELYKKMAEAKVVEIAKIAIDEDEADD